EGRALERRPQEDAVLVEIPHRQPPVAGFGSVRQGKIVLLAASRADHLAEPVGRGVPELRFLAGRAVLLDGGAEVCRVEHVGEAGTLPVYSTCGQRCPRLVVMGTTPFAAFDP